MKGKSAMRNKLWVGFGGAALSLAMLSAVYPAAVGVPRATSTVLGIVKCDGSTTNCANDGTISAIAAAAGLTVGASTVGSGTTTRVIFDNAGVVGEYAISGTGNVGMTTNGVFTTPNLGTPSALVLTNATGTPAAITLTNGTGLPVAGITGLGTGVGTALGINIGTAGAPVVLNGAGGTPSSLILTNATGLSLATGVTSTLPVANGGTGTASPGIVAGTNVTVTGTWPNQTVNSSGGGGGGTGCNPGGVATNLLTDDGAGACTSNAGAKYTAGNLTLGTAGSLVGSVTYANATSGTAKVHPPTGALGTADYTLPAAGTRIIVATDTTDTLTNKTINGANNTITARIANDVSGLGTGVATALGINVGSAGAPVVFNGAGGTPSSLTLTNATGLPISTGVNGLGTGVATALGNNLSAAGGVTTTIASGTSAMGTGAISSAACATVVTTTATNTATTDVVLASFNGDPTAVTGYVPATTGMLTIISYPTANNVNFKVCNNTGGSITPGALTLNWRVVR